MTLTARSGRCQSTSSISASSDGYGVASGQRISLRKWWHRKGGQRLLLRASGYVLSPAALALLMQKAITRFGAVQSGTSMVPPRRLSSRVRLGLCISPQTGFGSCFALDTARSGVCMLVGAGTWVICGSAFAWPRKLTKTLARQFPQMRSFARNPPQSPGTAKGVKFGVKPQRLRHGTANGWQGYSG